MLLFSPEGAELSNCASIDRHLSDAGPRLGGLDNGTAF